MGKMTPEGQDEIDAGLDAEQLAREGFVHVAPQIHSVAFEDDLEPAVYEALAARFESRQGPCYVGSWLPPYLDKEPQWFRATVKQVIDFLDSHEATRGFDWQVPDFETYVIEPHEKIVA